METVSIGNLRSYQDRGWPAISARVTIAGQSTDVYLRASHGPLTTGAEPFVHVGLFAAMRLGAALRIESAVSPRFLRHVDHVQDVLCTWYPSLHKAPVHAQDVSRADTATGGGVGCFFSGGVDSSYTVLKRRDELTHLIFVRGFDIPLNSKQLWELVAPPIRQAAVGLGKLLIDVETNVRSLIDPYVEWGGIANGGVLAGIALALAPQFERIYIAGAASYRMLAPLGSHALLDPLWSTERLEIVHDGGEVDRWQKMEKLATSRTALQWLRVCYENTGLTYNCGHCRKCLSVKCYLKAAGVLDDCPTFDKDIDLDAVAHLPIESLPVRSMRTSLLPAIERFGTQPELAAAVRMSIEASEQEHKISSDPTVPPDAAERLAALQAQVNQSEKRAARLAARLHALETSRSWRLTAPLRRLFAWMQRGDNDG